MEITPTHKPYTATDLMRDTLAEVSKPQSEKLLDRIADVFPGAAGASIVQGIGHAKAALPRLEEDIIILVMTATVLKQPPRCRLFKNCAFGTMPLDQLLATAQTNVEAEMVRTGKPDNLIPMAYMEMMQLLSRIAVSLKFIFHDSFFTRHSYHY